MEAGGAAEGGSPRARQQHVLAVLNADAALSELLQKFNQVFDALAAREREVAAFQDEQSGWQEETRKLKAETNQLRRDLAEREETIKQQVAHHENECRERDSAQVKEAFFAICFRQLC